MQKTLGLVLKKQNLGETDRILTIFSPTLGKKRVVARAVRRPTSKLAGHLDTLMVSQIILTDKPDLPQITSAVLVESFEAVRNSLTRVDRAFAVTKIVERVIIEDVPQQSVFQLTLDAIARLDQGSRWPAVWLMFLSTLTNQLGLGVGHFNCEQCGQKIATDCYWLSNDRVFRCRDCGVGGHEAIELKFNAVKLLNLLRQKNFPLLERLDLPNDIARPVEELLLREITDWFNKPWSSYASLKDDARLGGN